MSTKQASAPTLKTQSKFRPVKIVGKNDTHKSASPAVKKVTSSIIRPKASVVKTVVAEEQQQIAERKARVMVVKKSTPSNGVVAPAIEQPQAAGNVESEKRVKPRKEKQEVSSVNIAVLCPKLSRTCDVWNLTKCAYTCLDGDAQCRTDVDVCLFAGDALVMDYDITPTIVADGFYQLSGAIAVTNNQEIPLVITPKGFSLLVADFEGITPISVSIAEDLVVAAGATAHVPFSAAISTDAVVCAVAPDSNGEFAVQLTFAVDDVIVNAQSEFAAFECDDIACECATVGYTLTDEVEGEEPVVIRDASDPITSADSDTVFPIERPIVSGSTDTTAIITCPGEPTVVTNVATLTPLDPLPGACGPVGCPVTATATVTANCIIPEVTIDATSRIVYANNWSVEKTGEVLPPCKCGDKRDDEICCSKCYAKWQITLTNEGSIVEQEHNVQVCVNLGGECVAQYDKTFVVRLTIGDFSTDEELILLAGASQACRDIPLDPSLLDGTEITVSVYQQQGTFTTSNEACTFVLSDPVVLLPILLDEVVVVQTECIPGTTSTLYDTINFNGCRPHKDCVITLPDCDECNDCKRQIADATSIVLSSTQDEEFDPITVTLCDDDGDALRELLETLVQEGDDVDLDVVLQAFAPDFAPCSIPSVPNTIVLTFYTKIPKDKCGECTITNTVVVDTVPTAANPNGVPISSQDSATVEASDCKRRKPNGCGCKHSRHPHGCGCGCKHPRHPHGCGCGGKKSHGSKDSSSTFSATKSSCSTGTCSRRK